MVKVVDDRSMIPLKDPSDRELLLLINQSVETLTEKVDELKHDYVTKYGILENQLRLLDEKQTKDLKDLDDAFKHDIQELQKKYYMVYGALGLIFIVVTWLVSIYQKLR